MTKHLHSKRLIAVVTTFNRLEQMKTTLERLLAEPCELVLVVDNDSTDGTREWLTSLSEPRLRTVFPDENLGGAGGFELGLRTAMADYDPEWVVVMDDDARPCPGAFAEFHSSASTEWDIMAAAVYYPDHKICEVNRPSVNPFWHLRTFLTTLLGGGRGGFHISDDTYALTTPTPIDVSSFVGMFISSETIKHIGYPDGSLFIYGDDVLYSLRARKAENTIGFFPNIQFEHDCSTFKSQSQGCRPYWKVYYNYRNALAMYRTAAGIFFPAVLLVVIPKWFSLGRKYGTDRTIFNRLLRRAIWDGITQHKRLTHDEVLDLVKTLDG